MVKAGSARIICAISIQIGPSVFDMNFSYINIRTRGRSHERLHCMVLADQNKFRMFGRESHNT